jgi:hypothetical protein
VHQQLNFSEEILKLHRGPTLEELEEDKKARKQRAMERSERAREKLNSQEPQRIMMTQEEKEYPFMRRAWGNGGGGDWASGLEDPSQEYDKWAQAYRMLGGYIDCDHSKSQRSGDRDQNNEDGGDGDSVACSRWMIWAAYVDESYAGNEYDEYYGDNPAGVMDCHDPDTSWKLLGVYRQEFYQFIEQISKHVWAIDEYEYVTALAGLAYMTDGDCWDTGSADNSGNTIYAGVQPLEGGWFQMALYTDGGYCLTPNENLGMTFDDLGFGSDLDLGSGDQGDDGGYAYDGDLNEWWQSAQEASLTNLNEVYQTFRYCVSCVDYPTYQDGYFIGDDGTDDDDLINQCWKFWSHDSYICETDCLAKANAQGTILSINYQSSSFGNTPSTFYENYARSGSGKRSETKLTRLLANVFVAFSFIVFVATFLAFAVARRSRQREKRSSKRRRLLDEDGRSRSSRSARRRRDPDGLFRSSRSKSTDRHRSSSGKSRSKSASAKPRSKSASRPRRPSEDGYEPPVQSSTRRSSTHRQSSSRRPLDDF